MTQEIIPADATASADIVLHETFVAVAAQLAPRSRYRYEADTRHFATWLSSEGRDMFNLSRDDFLRYRQHLADRYAKTTAARMFAVARRLCTEAVRRGVLTNNPAADIRGFGGGHDETPHTVLSLAQAQALLDTIDRTTKLGQRDYALILLLLRTGIRRSEAAALQLGDVGQEGGHSVLTIRHGKGDKRRRVKVPVDVLRAIQAYLDGAGRAEAEPTAALFVRFYKGDTPGKAGLTDRAIADIVGAHARAVEVELSPHGLRATFVTLALEGGAKLQQVQYAAGHADPRTTERYQKRKLNLDDNAVDYVRVYNRG